jgi:hypothetical protein
MLGESTMAQRKTPPDDRRRLHLSKKKDQDDERNWDSNQPKKNGHLSTSRLRLN